MQQLAGDFIGVQRGTVASIGVERREHVGHPGDLGKRVHEVAIEALAKVMVEKKLAPTQAQAITKVLEENKELYERYTTEQREA